MKNIEKIFVTTKTTIKETLQVIEKGQKKIAIVVDNNKKFLGVINDGDIRRALISKYTLTDKIENIFQVNCKFSFEDVPESEIKKICEDFDIDSIPILNQEKKVCDIYNSKQKAHIQNHVVFMVGGLGSRLQPLTNDTPKPMLKINRKPILQIVLEKFIKEGFVNFCMCVGYLHEEIQSFFGDGAKFGVNIEYVIETKRMGTAGALSFLRGKHKLPFFVMNGDILTQESFKDILEFHSRKKSKATMCVSEYDFTVPYGVVNIIDECIDSIEEKPVHTFYINSGIYIINPDCLEIIPTDEYYEMTTLFETLINNKEPVSSYIIQDNWIDIGSHSDFKTAKLTYEKWEV